VHEPTVLRDLARFAERLFANTSCDAGGVLTLSPAETAVERAVVAMSWEGAIPSLVTLRVPPGSAVCLTSPARATRLDAEPADVVPVRMTVAVSRTHVAASVAGPTALAETSGCSGPLVDLLRALIE
jgi:hypothetical protein